MPSAPPRACRCGAIVASGTRCPTCTSTSDRVRGSARQRGYDADWEAFRADYLRLHPTCTTPSCGQPATDVDHIRALRLGGARLDPSNCRALCHSCHSRRTATEQRGGYVGMPVSKPRPMGGGPHGATARRLGKIGSQEIRGIW